MIYRVFCGFKIVGKEENVPSNAHDAYVNTNMRTYNKTKYLYKYL